MKRPEFFKLDHFVENDTVLAKQKYSCPWPSRILRIEKSRVFVYFYGDKRSGFVDSDEVYDFKKSLSALRSVILTAKKGPTLITGVQEVELLLGISADDSIFNSH